MSAKNRDLVWAIFMLVAVVVLPVKVAIVNASFLDGMAVAFGGIVVSVIFWRIFVYPQIMREEERFALSVRSARVSSLYP